MITDHEIAEIREFVTDTINKVPGFSVEYFEIADDRELIPLKEKAEMTGERKYFGCIAVQAGKVRLIDNVEFGLV